MRFDREDHPMKEILKACLEDIRLWHHYDNYQHGYYVNENKCGYGKIIMCNAQVHVKTENLEPRERDEEYKKIWGEYETWHTYFRGDLSERRHNYLVELAKKFPQVIEITVKTEVGEDVYKIEKGGKITALSDYWVNFAEERNGMDTEGDEAVVE